MMIDTQSLKETLIKLKEQTSNTLDRAKQNKVKNHLLAIITVIESILIWIHQSEKEGELNMDELKISLGKVVKLSDIKPASRSKIDNAIIEGARILKDMDDAVQIDPAVIEAKKLNITYFTNRVYTLAKEGKIHVDAKPVKVAGKVYIALRPTTKRKMRSKEAVK